ncbi:MAG TPA: DUF2851 family protein [Verrucomicrobiae bacterium]|nr:DUF2851 family protein [Verrucomicrobiae bacterium]
MENVYTCWRAGAVAGTFLRDENFPAERLLQAVWQHQRLHREGLKTANGKSMRIFHPGFASVEGGPDFRDAVLQIGDDAPRSGDVEIDLNASGWRAHGHDKNPNFKNVLLHVVWEIPKTQAADAPAILCLQNVLDAPLAELSLSLENASLRALPESFRGKCCAPLRELDERKLPELLNQAAAVRFQNKAEQFRVRAKSAGWEQTLWENLFRALGYKHNVWPMQNVAEMKTNWSRRADSVLEFQARLFGIGNLLPDELTRAQKSSDSYLRRIWDIWWRERDGFEDYILPRVSWKFHGLRPANHPQRRLALAAHWLARRDFVREIEKWVVSEIPDKKLLSSLHGILQVEQDEFWSWHWTFKSPRLKNPQPLLGDARVTDLAVNVILPWLWIRAGEGRSEKIQRKIERRYFAWPAAEDNSVLKLARQRLLGGSNGKFFTTAAAQQGLIQIIRDFCDHSNAVCDNCQFPGLVRDWKR